MKSDNMLRLVLGFRDRIIITHPLILLCNNPLLEFLVQGRNFFDGTFFGCDSGNSFFEPTNVEPRFWVGKVEEATGCLIKENFVKFARCGDSRNSMGCTPARSCEVHTNYAQRSPCKRFTTKRTGWAKSRRGFFNDTCATTGTKDVPFYRAKKKIRKVGKFEKILTYRRTSSEASFGGHILLRRRRRRSRGLR